MYNFEHIREQDFIISALYFVFYCAVNSIRCIFLETMLFSTLR